MFLTRQIWCKMLWAIWKKIAQINWLRKDFQGRVEKESKQRIAVVHIFIA